MTSVNSRLFEKDIFEEAAYDDDEGGSSSIVDLNYARSFSCQLIFTVVDASGLVCEVSYWKSNDRINWTRLGFGVPVRATGTDMMEEDEVSYRYFKAIKEISGGEVSLKAKTVVIGDEA